MTIRNDATRPEARLTVPRRARALVARQGQVLLDIDITSVGDIAADRTELDALDTLGPLAAPLAASGFEIGIGGTISAGRIYLDGLLVENPAATTLEAQPHPAEPLPAGPAILGIKALVRHVDPAEDRRLVDKALGDATGSGRALVDWQVFALPLAAGTPAICGAASADWDNLVAPSSGRLSVRVDPGVGAADFCTPAAGGGYARLEDLLYRLEVDGGTPVVGLPTIDGPRFGLDGLRLKLSRRNASVMTRIVGIAGRELTLDPPALDAGQWFAAGGAAELVSLHDDVDPRAAAGQTRLFTVARAEDDRVTLGGLDALPLPAAADLDDGWYLRLWDTFPGFAISATAAGGAEFDCGDGVLATAQADATGETLFRRGDWWSFTARVDGTIDWPESVPGTPLARAPDGPVIHYARLAATDDPTAVPVDCRPVFLPLTQQHTLLYRGGDGQTACLTDSADPFVPLRDRLRVAVVRGGLPVPGMAVRWSSPDTIPSSQVRGEATPVLTTTDALGETDVIWSLDRNQPDAAYELVAELVTPPGPAVAPVRFGAGFETAARTSYQPGACDLLAGAASVQDALDILCRNIGGGGAAPPETLRLKEIRLLATDRPLIQDDLILNGIDIEPQDLTKGIVFACDNGPLAGRPEAFDPIVDVELEMPYPTTRPDLDYWRQAADLIRSFGTQRLRLAGSVELKENVVVWQPSDDAAVFLDRARQHLFGEGGKRQLEVRQEVRILTRLRLRSQFVWVEGRERERIYLNAEHLGVEGPVTRRELATSISDPQRAADLDMFFYLLVRR